MKKEPALILILLAGLGTSIAVARWMDSHRADYVSQFNEEQLYLDGRMARRLTFAFNGIAADWYWMRSLQYLGRKIVAYEDTHDGRFELNDLSTLELRQLPALLRVTTTLDPQFIPAYEYGAMILPEVNPDEAILLLNSGIAANPQSWRLYQHLGYIYWQRKEYEKASATYATGASLPDAPSWMTAMAARMRADGGSRNAAREMYLHLAEGSNDKSVKDMVSHQLMRLDWLDDRDAIQKALNEYRARSGRCAGAWRELIPFLRGTKIRVDAVTGAPVDPSGVPYRLINGGCDVDLDLNSKVPH